MRKRKKIKSQQKNKNYYLLTTFFLIVTILIVLALTLKIIAIAVKSGYDGAHRFTIAFTSSQQKEQLVSFSPEDKTISVLSVISNKPIGNLQQALAIPVSITVPGSGFLTNDNISLQLFKLIPQVGIARTHFTIFDILRLSLFATHVSPGNITSASISLPSDQSTIDQNVSTLFKEQTISQENSTVQILNATGEQGVGNRLARILTNYGFTVIAVETADTAQNTSAIAYHSKNSYTFTYLSSFLHYQTKPLQNQGISDIIITIGKDSLQTHAF